MSFLNMDSIRQTIGTIDKFQLINSNYIKDKISRNNNQERIINHMKKLGYLNFNMIEESRKFLLNLLSMNQIGNDFNGLTLNEIFVILKYTDAYKAFEKETNYKISRSILLTKYLSNQNDTYSFYNDLTIDELNIIS
jgi:hypothetical protein